MKKSPFSRLLNVALAIGMAACGSENNKPKPPPPASSPTTPEELTLEQVLEILPDLNGEIAKISGNLHNQIVIFLPWVKKFFGQTKAEPIPHSERNNNEDLATRAAKTMDRINMCLAQESPTIQHLNECHQSQNVQLSLKKFTTTRTLSNGTREEVLIGFEFSITFLDLDGKIEGIFTYRAESQQEKTKVIYIGDFEGNHDDYRYRDSLFISIGIGKDSTEATSRLAALDGSLEEKEERLWKETEMIPITTTVHCRSLAEQDSNVEGDPMSDGEWTETLLIGIEHTSPLPWQYEGIDGPFEFEINKLGTDVFLKNSGNISTDGNLLPSSFPPELEITTHKTGNRGDSYTFPDAIEKRFVLDLGHETETLHGENIPREAEAACRLIYLTTTTQPDEDTPPFTASLTSIMGKLNGADPASPETHPDLAGLNALAEDAAGIRGIIGATTIEWDQRR